MSTVALTSAPVTTPDVRKEILETRRRSFYVKDVAHARAGEMYDKRGRWLGLVVVIMTTIVGTSAFASIQGNPSTAAKVTVAIISVFAALAAAIKEYAGYEKVATQHGSTARAFRRLRYSTDELLVALLRGAPDEIQSAITDLDAKANEVHEPALPKGGYAKAEAWVDGQIKNHTRGGATDVL